MICIKRLKKYENFQPRRTENRGEELTKINLKKLEPYIETIKSVLDEIGLPLETVDDVDVVQEDSAHRMLKVQLNKKPIGKTSHLEYINLLLVDRFDHPLKKLGLTLYKVMLEGSQDQEQLEIVLAHYELKKDNSIFRKKVF